MQQGFQVQARRMLVVAGLAATLIGCGDEKSGKTSGKAAEAAPGARTGENSELFRARMLDSVNVREIAIRRMAANPKNPNPALQSFQEQMLDGAREGVVAAKTSINSNDQEKAVLSYLDITDQDLRAISQASATMPAAANQR